MNTQVNRFKIALIATLCWMIVMRLYSPTNMVQFELAGTTQEASDIIAKWGVDGVALAQTGTYLDFIFLLFYGGCFAFGCRVAANFSGKALLIKIGAALFWLVWAAAACDVIENIAMLQTMMKMNQATALCNLD